MAGHGRTRVVGLFRNGAAPPVPTSRHPTGPGGDQEGHRWAGTAMDELVSFLSWRIRSSYRSTPDWTVYGIFTFCEGGSAMSDLVTRRTT